MPGIQPSLQKQCRTAIGDLGQSVFDALDLGVDAGGVGILLGWRD